MEREGGEGRATQAASVPTLGNASDEQSNIQTVSFAGKNLSTMNGTDLMKEFDAIREQYHGQSIILDLSGVKVTDDLIAALTRTPATPQEALNIQRLTLQNAQGLNKTQAMLGELFQSRQIQSIDFTGSDIEIGTLNNLSNSNPSIRVITGLGC